MLAHSRAARPCVAGETAVAGQASVPGDICAARRGGGLQYADGLRLPRRSLWRRRERVPPTMPDLSRPAGRAGRGAQNAPDKSDGAPQKFQSLEVYFKEVPAIGSFDAESSNHWKFAIIGHI